MAAAPLTAADYTWTFSGSSNWATTTSWTPNTPAGGPVDGDNIYLGTGLTGSIITALGGTTASVGSIARSAGSWIIGGGGTSPSTLNIDTIDQTASATTIFRNLTAGGLFTVNVRNITSAAGGVYFGAASTAAGQTISGLNVTGTTTITAGMLSLNVDNATDTYSLGLLVLGSGTVNLTQANSGTNRQTVANVNGLSGAGGVIQGYNNNSNGSLTNSSTLAITNSGNFTSGAVIRDYQSGGLAGALSITKSGTGTQTLTANNTYTGVTTINEGAIQIGSGGSTGSIVGNVDMTSSDASLIVNRTGTFAYSGTITGSGQVIKRGGGTLNLYGASSYTGGTVIEAGVVQVVADNGFGDVSGAVTFNNGSTQATVNFNDIMSSNRNFVINGTQARLNVTGTNSSGANIVATLNGQISGSGGVNKRFAGTLVLTDGNTYQGGTVISTGTLVAQNTDGSATGTGGVTVEANGNLAGNGTIAPDAGNNIVVQGAIHPGFDSVDTLTLDLTGASKLSFEAGSELNMTLGTASDLVAFSSLGDWLSGTDNLMLNLTLGDGFSYDDSYVIFSNANTVGFTLAGVTGFDTGLYTSSFQQIGDDYVLSFNAVPEPSVWMLLGIGLTAILWRQRRKLVR